MWRAAEGGDRRTNRDLHDDLGGWSRRTGGGGDFGGIARRPARSAECPHSAQYRARLGGGHRRLGADVHLVAALHPIAEPAWRGARSRGFSARGLRAVDRDELGLPQDVLGGMEQPAALADALGE